MPINRLVSRFIDDGGCHAMQPFALSHVIETHGNRTKWQKPILVRLIKRNDVKVPRTIAYSIDKFHIKLQSTTDRLLATFWLRSAIAVHAVCGPRCASTALGHACDQSSARIRMMRLRCIFATCRKSWRMEPLFYTRPPCVASDLRYTRLLGEHKTVTVSIGRLRLTLSDVLHRMLSISKPTPVYVRLRQQKSHLSEVAYAAMRVVWNPRTGAAS